MTTAVIGHRGAPRVARENTLEAFAAAVSLGADGVELDVRATSDGRLAVHHDPVTAGGVVIGTSRWADLPPYVPELGEVLEACGRLLVNVEVKSDPDEPGHDPGEATARLTARLLIARLLSAGRLRPDSGGPVVVSSFSLAALEAAEAEAGPHSLELAYLVSPRRLSAAEALEVVRGHGWSGVHPWWGMVEAGFVAKAHDAGVAVRVWTVDEPAAIAQLAAAGVDGIVTNDPAAALAALGRP